MGIKPNALFISRAVTKVVAIGSFTHVIIEISHQAIMRMTRSPSSRKAPGSAPNRSGNAITRCACRITLTKNIQEILVKNFCTWGWLSD